MKSGRFILLATLVTAVTVPTLVGHALAETPPAPDFFWPYGKVLLNGGNISPPVQLVIGLANGRACGVDQTLIAQAGPETPADDVGKTVYVVNIVADGSRAGQRPGCGRPGDPVTLYFPESRRVGLQQTLFQQGGLRVDLDLGPELSNRLIVPIASSDGAY